MLEGTLYVRLIFAKGNIISIRYDSPNVYVSTDNASTWNVTLNPIGATYFYWSIAKDNADNVYLATYGSPNSPSVYKSSDGGLTWVIALSLPFVTHIHEVAIDPYTNDVWVATGDSASKKDVWMSTDDGNTWVKVIPGVQFTAIEFTNDFVVLGTDELFGTNSIYLYDKLAGTYARSFTFPSEYNWKAIYDIEKTSNGVFVATMVKYTNGSDLPEQTLWKSYDLYDWRLIGHQSGHGWSYNSHMFEYKDHVYITKWSRLPIKDLRTIQGDNWTIASNSVFIDDPIAYISVSPHTVTLSGWVEVDLKLKQYSGSVDFAFGFNRDDTAQIKSLQIRQNSEWLTLDTPTNRETFSLITQSGDSADTWYTSTGFNVTAGTTYRGRFWVDIPLNTKEYAKGKYFVAFKPSNKTLSEARATNTLYYLDPWWDAAWSTSYTLSFNSVNQTENLLNFPVTVFLTPARVDFSKIAINGTDIRFIDADGVTQLPYDITSWNGTAGSENATIVVQVPQINASSNYTDFITMYTGNAGASDNQSRNAVWANTGAKAVWTMYNNTETDNMTGTSIFNSVSTNLTGTSTNTTWSTESGRAFGGVNSRISVANHADLSVGGSQNFTILAWFNGGSAVINSKSIIDKSDTLNQEYILRTGATTDIFMRTGNTTTTKDSPTITLNTSAFNLLSFGRADNTLFGGKNGVVTYSADLGTWSITSNALDSLIGSWAGAAGGFLTGNISELRFYKKALSIQEILYTYRSEQAKHDLGDGEYIRYGNGLAEPTIVTNAAQNVSMIAAGVTSGNFSGNVSTLGLPTASVWFDYALLGAPGFTANTTPQTITTTGEFKDTFPTNLTPGATYVYRASANNSAGYGYGANVTFTFTMPTVTTVSASLSGLVVTLTGNVTNAGVASNSYVRFQYGTTPSLGSTTTQQTQAGTGTFTDTVPVGSDTTLYYRSMVTNGATNVFGVTNSLSTPPGAGGLILKSMLRVFLAAVIIIGVMIASRMGALAMAIAGVVGLLAFILVDAVINMFL